MLVFAGADTDATTLLDTHLTNVGLISAGSTALHIAAHADHVDVVKVRDQEYHVNQDAHCGFNCNAHKGIVAGLTIHHKGAYLKDKL